MVVRQNWFDVHGDETLALDWPLNESSHVWEIGGFEGRWAQQISDKFNCNITIFEPQLWAVDRLLRRFSKDPNVKIRPYGLWTHSAVIPIGNYNTDGASIIHDDGREQKQLGVFMEIRDEVFTEEELWGLSDPIDLALMNIEGAEYLLLPYMIEMLLMEEFKYFWCQFHPNGEEDTRHIEIFSGMERTHDLLWDCYPTAVAWRKK